MNKPTDEAKRLQEEINSIIADMVCDHQSDESTAEIINKVLDAVTSETNSLNIGWLDYEDRMAIKSILKQGINKLRP